jgi:hypothetical protein
MSDPIVLSALDPKATDAALAAHYGDAMREQRARDRDVALVDRSNRGVIAITGPERLTWLHNVTTQHPLSAPRQRHELRPFAARACEAPCRGHRRRRDDVARREPPRRQRCSTSCSRCAS